MKIKSLKIAGFRGFNAERALYFHHDLTLIAAPNSHGKTSISEALEFLLSGATSKVEHADSKEEYADSYRNRHYPTDKPAYVEATMEENDGKDVSLRVELDAAGNVQRFYNGKPVSGWPFDAAMSTAARPFILQHALKYLLLVRPTERFQGFARLLGLNEVDTLQQAIVNLCTKPEASVPLGARQVMAGVATLEERMEPYPELAKIEKEFKKGPNGLANVYKIVETRINKILGRTVLPGEQLAALIQARDAANAKIFSGSVAIKQMQEVERRQFELARDALSAAIDSAFLSDYGKLSSRGVAERLRLEADLLNIGVQLIDESVNTCLICGQKIGTSERDYLKHRHEEVGKQVAGSDKTSDVRARAVAVIRNIKTNLDTHGRMLNTCGAQLLLAANPANEVKVKDLFGVENAASWEIVSAAAKALAPVTEEWKTAGGAVRTAIGKCETAFRDSKEELSQAEELAKSLQNYLLESNKVESRLGELTQSLVAPSRLLQTAIDRLAGTAELTLIIDIIEKKTSIERGLRVRQVLEGLKKLKKHVDQTVGETMEAAINTELTKSVMGWYGRIRTKGDPDVHFSGFSMERTKAGEFKSKRLKVNANSYGVELASAVSSLSESKLNALGLCVSIASSLRSPGPWDFLVVDDPIQSWDDEHEVQFIDVIRSLVEQEKKQVILLSHKGAWIKTVCLGCRTFNGFRYEITGFDQEGPHYAQVLWAPVDERLREAETIANDTSASSVRLQQAEEEIRLAACQLASEIALKRLKRVSSPHNMNSKDVRAILNSAGCTAELTDKVVATFGTSDDAHHAPKHYQPNAQRIRQHIGTLRELVTFANK